MFQSFKGRTIEIGQRVNVYKNLHNDLWSIRDHKSKLVLGYADEVVLEDAEFKISESVKQRAIRERRRNVHAYAVGTLVSFDIKGYVFPERVVGYHYIHTKTFIDKKTKEPIYKAKLVVFTKEKVFAR